MLNGIINVYKEKEMTSHDAVAILRRVTGQKRIGHTGTLDPMVTGVLPICLGQATRVAEYISDQGKAYRGKCILGFRTDTLDITGEKVVESKQDFPTQQELEHVFQSFEGKQKQLPPMYSAVKIGGRKLYEYAREGKEVARKTRDITISELRIENYEHGEITFYCACSKGTYIRQLVDDIGVRLGTYATLADLERVQVGPYLVDDAISIFKLREMEPNQLMAYLHPVDSAIAKLPKMVVTEKMSYALCNGQRLNWEASAAEVIEGAEAIERMDYGERISESGQSVIRVYSKKQFIGIGYFVYEQGTLYFRMKKVFHHDTGNQIEK